MLKVQSLSSVGAVSEIGERVRSRRTAIGMSVSALAKEAGVDRGSLTALEAGQGVRDTTVAAVEKTLDALEREMGMDVPSVVATPTAPAEVPEATEHPASEPIRLTFHDVYGIGEIIAEGPGDKPDDLVAAVAKLLAEIRGGKIQP